MADGTFRQITDKITLGPDYIVTAGLHTRPSRDTVPCGFCEKPLDVTKRHAVVAERYDGMLTAGRYAHIRCAEGTEHGN